MAKGTCSVDGCERPSAARGFCYPHYGTWHRQTYGRKDAMHERTCVVCATTWSTRRAAAKYCSDLCKAIAYSGGPLVCRLPRHHPVMVSQRPPKTITPGVTRDCAWCGEWFVARRDDRVMCSLECKQRRKAARRRGRERGWVSMYTWTEVMALFLKFGKCCAYCEQTIDGQPDPDHVVPLSRGGSNSITNILPSCRPCNSDKRDLLLDEWAADRARRDKPARVTTWADDDPRVAHLTCLLAPRAAG